MNFAGGSDGNKDTGFLEVRRYPIHAVRNFSEKHDIGSHCKIVRSAIRTNLFPLVEADSGEGLFALSALGSLEITVQMENSRRAG